MNNLLKNWDMIRIIRLVAGIGFGVYAITSQEYLFLILAGMFLVQAVFNLSCCGAGGCSAGTNQKALYKDEVKPYRPGKK